MFIIFQKSQFLHPNKENTSPIRQFPLFFYEWRITPAQIAPDLRFLLTVFCRTRLKITSWMLQSNWMTQKWLGPLNFWTVFPQRNIFPDHGILLIVFILMELPVWWAFWHIDCFHLLLICKTLPVLNLNKTASLNRCLVLTWFSRAVIYRLQLFIFCLHWKPPQYDSSSHTAFYRGTWTGGPWKNFMK